MQPTIVIATGNGAHAWWLFKEPYIFDGDDDRQAVANQVDPMANAAVFECLFARVGLRPPLRLGPGPEDSGTQNLKDPAN